MKIAELIWIICKTKHLIELISKSIIIFTDHSATILIVWQTHLIIIININKLYLWLVYALQYLSQFDLNVQHQSEKIHLISNALSELLDDMSNKNKKDIIDTLNDIEFYHIILIKLTNNFKKCLQDAYKKDTQWKWILNIIKLMNYNLNTVNEDIAEQSAKLHFTY